MVFVLNPSEHTLRAYIESARYKLGAMTSAPFAEPKLMESAARLEAEAVRSQTAQ